MVKFSLALVALVSPLSVNAFGGMNPQPKQQQEISRRESLMKSIGVIGGVASSFPFIANAEPSEETPRIVTRMGGLLVSTIISFRTTPTLDGLLSYLLKFNSY